MVLPVRVFTKICIFATAVAETAMEMESVRLWNNEAALYGLGFVVGELLCCESMRVYAGAYGDDVDHIRRGNVGPVIIKYSFF